MIQKTLVDTEEAAHAILEYIASEDFDKAEKAIEDVRMQQNLCTLAAPVMLAADVLQNYCSNLSKGCEHCEQELKTLTNKLNEAFANLEKALKERC